jgi:uncharacterized protein YndB with AHSA1/START domain
MSKTPEFIITRRFAAPIERVFTAWADPGQMAEWSGPKGSRTVVLSGEVAEGSTMFARAEQDGEAYTHMLTRYLEVVPFSRIAWEQSFADEHGNKTEPAFAPGWPVTLLTEVDFASDGDETVVTLRWQPVDATPEQEQMFADNLASMNGGWSSSFNKLDQYLAAA